MNSPRMMLETETTENRIDHLESQLEKVELAIAQVEALEMGSAGSTTAASRESTQSSRLKRSSQRARRSQDGPQAQQSEAPASGSDSLSSILAADAAIALSLLASRATPPPSASPEPGLSGPISSPVSSASKQQLAPVAPPPPPPSLAPAPSTAPVDIAPPDAPENSRLGEDAGAPAPQTPTDTIAEGKGAGDAPLPRLRGASPRLDASSPSRRPSPVVGASVVGASSPSRRPSPVGGVSPGSPKGPVPPLGAADSASTNIVFEVMNALCAPPANPDDPNADASAPSSSGSEARLVSGGDDGTIRVWNVGDGEAGAVMRGHKGAVCSLVVLPNGRIASGSADKNINIWRLSTGKLERSLKGHTHTVCALACFKDDRLISGSEDCMVKVWNSDPGACLVTLAGHTNTVTGVASVTDEVVVSSSGDSTLRVWSLSTSSCIQVLRNHTGLVRSVIEVTSDQHRWLVSGAADRTVKVWKREASVGGDAAAAVWTFFDQLATGGGQPAEGDMANTDTWTCVNTLSHPSSVQGLAALGNDSFLTVSDSTVRVWRLEDSTCAREIDLGSSKSAVTACPKEGWAAFGSPSGDIEVWDYLSPGQGSPLLARTCEGHQGPVRALEYILADWRTRVRTACYF